MLNPLPSLLILFGLIGLLVILKEPKVKNNNFSKILEVLLVRLRILALRLDQSTSKFLNRIRKQRVLKDAEKINFSSKHFTNSLPSANIPSRINSKESINFLKEELKLLRVLSKSSEKEEALVNLARLYLWKKDFSSARWTLVQIYRINKDNRIANTLIVELVQKDNQK